MDEAMTVLALLAFEGMFVAALVQWKRAILARGRASDIGFNAVMSDLRAIPLDAPDFDERIQANDLFYARMEDELDRYSYTSMLFRFWRDPFSLYDMDALTNPNVVPPSRAEKEGGA